MTDFDSDFRYPEQGSRLFPCRILSPVGEVKRDVSADKLRELGRHKYESEGLDQYEKAMAEFLGQEEKEDKRTGVLRISSKSRRAGRVSQQKKQIKKCDWCGRTINRVAWARFCSEKICTEARRKSRSHKNRR